MLMTGPADSIPEAARTVAVVQRRESHKWVPPCNGVEHRTTDAVPSFGERNLEHKDVQVPVSEAAEQRMILWALV